MYAPIPKKAAWPKENIPAKPPMMFHPTASVANMNVMIMTWSGKGVV